VLEREDQSLEMHAELVATMMEYSEETVQLNKIRKYTNKLLNYSQQIQGEEEALNHVTDL
jgi:hypothetical protein